jgi:hypothetical protein
LGFPGWPVMMADGAASAVPGAVEGLDGRFGGKMERWREGGEREEDGRL